MINDAAARINELRREGLGYKRIAARLELPVNTVKSYIRRHPMEAPALAREERCLNCGGLIQQNPGRKEKKFCSDRCRMAWWNTHPEAVQRKTFYEITCACCGQTFQSYGNNARKYCSRSCYDRSRMKGGVGNV